MNKKILQLISKLRTGIKEKANEVTFNPDMIEKVKGKGLHKRLLQEVFPKHNIWVSWVMVILIIITMAAAISPSYITGAVMSITSGGYLDDITPPNEINALNVINPLEDCLINKVSLFPRNPSITALSISPVNDSISEAQEPEQMSEYIVTDHQDNNMEVETQKPTEETEDTIEETTPYISQDNNIVENNISGNGINRWNISLTDDEIDLLARIVWVESRGEPVLGQEAVVEVTLNRMMSEDFPEDLYSVLSAKRQYASWEIRDTADYYDEQVEVVKSVLNGGTNILPTNTYYFATKPLTDDIVTVIGHHYFCR